MAPSKPSCFEVEDWGHTKQISNQRKTESKQRKQSFSPMVVTWDMTELSGFQRTWVEPAFQHDGYQHMYFSLGNCICNFFWTYPIILGSQTTKSFHFNWDLFFFTASHNSFLGLLARYLTRHMSLNLSGSLKLSTRFLDSQFSLFHACSISTIRAKR